MGKLTEVDVKLGGNKISPMSRAIEECAELIQALIKVERFGWFNYHPLDVDRTTNMELVRREADDVRNALDRLDNHMRDVAYNHYNREDRTYEIGK